MQNTFTTITNTIQTDNIKNKFLVSLQISPIKFFITITLFDLNSQDDIGEY